jgi:DNA-binding NtrC family response regulator
VNQPLFILDRKRRIIFVNNAWEQFTKVEFAEARGLACTRRGSQSEDRRGTVARTLWPPPEVLKGQCTQARRRMEGSSTGWWDIEFFPLQGPEGLLCILGRITGAPMPENLAYVPIPEALRKLRDQLAKGMPAEKAAQLWTAEKLVGLREAHSRRFRLQSLESPLAAMRRVVDQARLASDMAHGVYLTGESGIGKTWLARAIHHYGPARERAFVRLDCALLPSPAIADTLFGGAGLLRRPGIGTIYFKEPARLPHDLQFRLHEWLEQNSTEDSKTAPHVLAGAVATPVADVHSGQLLERLYASLATLVIELPALRERMADLPNLVDRLLERHNASDEHKISGLTPAAWELVREYRWPDNLRELDSMLATASARAKGDSIDVPDLPNYLRQAVRLEQIPAPGPKGSLPLDSILEQVERRVIDLAMRRSRGNKSRAAELLSVWRPRLLRRMEALVMEQRTEDRGQKIEDREGESDRDADTRPP